MYRQGAGPRNKFYPSVCLWQVLHCHSKYKFMTTTLSAKLSKTCQKLVKNLSCLFPFIIHRGHCIATGLKREKRFCNNIIMIYTNDKGIIKTKKMGNINISSVVLVISHFVIISMEFLRNIIRETPFCGKKHIMTLEDCHDRFKITNRPILWVNGIVLTHCSMISVNIYIINGLFMH